MKEMQLHDKRDVIIGFVLTFVKEESGEKVKKEARVGES